MTPSHRSEDAERPAQVVHRTEARGETGGETARIAKTSQMLAIREDQVKMKKIAHRGGEIGYPAAAPLAAEQIYTSGLIPIAALYRSEICSANVCASAAFTRFTVHPPNPPPVMRPPQYPARDWAISAMTSSSRQLTSKRSRRLRCDSCIRAPNRLTSPSAIYLAPASTRWFSDTTCRQR